VDNVEIVKGAYEAFARGDVPAVLSILSDDVDWNEAENNAPFSPGRYRGPQEVLGSVFMRIPEVFDGFQVEVRRLVGCDDTVLAEVRYHATGKATGMELDAQVAHVWDMRDGKVVHWQQYLDTWQVNSVTGTQPQSARPSSAAAGT
jgi:uncharacterized protein